MPGGGPVAYFLIKEKEIKNFRLGEVRRPDFLVSISRISVLILGGFVFFLLGGYDWGEAI
jgi:hypothetical protein